MGALTIPYIDTFGNVQHSSHFLMLGKSEISTAELPNMSISRRANSLNLASWWWLLFLSLLLLILDLILLLPIMEFCFAIVAVIHSWKGCADPFVILIKKVPQ